MSVSCYAYVGPIIRIKNDLTIDSSSAICSNNQCPNHNHQNSIAERDAFCSKCGSKVELGIFKKSIGKDFHEIVAQDEDFEDMFSEIMDILPDAGEVAIFNGGKDYAISKSALDTNIFIIDEKSAAIMMKKFLADEDVKNILNVLDVKYDLRNFEIRFGFTTYSSY